MVGVFYILPGMLTWRKRILANYHYLRRPLWRFLPLLMATVVILIAGGFAFLDYSHHGSAEPITYREALFITVSLIFMEYAYPFPDHWLQQIFYFLLPPLGLLVFLDGFLRFGYHILRRDELSKEWVTAVAKTFRNHVILCGLGKVGLRVLEQLLRLGENVVILEKNEECANLAQARKHGVPVMIGNGREAGIFDELNAKAAKSIILCTDDDLANMEMALDARKAKPNIRVVMRLFDQELADKVQDAFDIHLAFSTSEIAAPLFATSSSDRSILNAFYVGEELVTVAKIVVKPDSGLVGRTIADVAHEHQLFVLSLIHDGDETLYPPGDMEFQPWDRCTLQTSTATLKQIHLINRDQEPF